MIRFYRVISFAILIGLLIVFSIASFFFASNIGQNLQTSKNELLKERIKQYREEGYSYKTWSLNDLDIKTESTVVEIYQKCTDKCKSFLKGTDYSPIDSFVLFEQSGICYCFYS
ncbi:MAG: hypothetical protein QXD62_01875 [Candidatus Woesearchaeota archaeon]